MGGEKPQVSGTPGQALAALAHARKVQRPFPELQMLEFREQRCQACSERLISNCS